MFGRVCAVRTRSAEKGHRNATLVASVTALARLGEELLRAIVADEVVAGEDLVDLEALRAGEAVAHVALQQSLVRHDLAALPIGEQRGARNATTRLAAGRELHVLSIVNW